MGLEQIEVELQAVYGDDVDIANAAWTSTYDKGKREGKYDDQEKVDKLVDMLVSSGHSVPVESVILRFWYKFPIFVDRQHMTHRIASHNGLSGRYRTMPKDFYRLPDDIELILQKLPANSRNRVRDLYYNTLLKEWAAYEECVIILKGEWKADTITNSEYKRCREVIRGILGTAFFVERTTIFNLRSFCNYMKLRKSEHAQAEICCVAEHMYHALTNWYKKPASERMNISNGARVAVAALEKKGWTV